MIGSQQAEIGRTTGFLVADVRGRPIGHVERPIHGAAPDEPDALAVRSGVLRRQFVVPAAAIDAIDDRSKVIGLCLERGKLRRPL